MDTESFNFKVRKGPDQANHLYAVLKAMFTILQKGESIRLLQSIKYSQSILHPITYAQKLPTTGEDTEKFFYWFDFFKGEKWKYNEFNCRVHMQSTIDSWTIRNRILDLLRKNDVIMYWTVIWNNRQGYIRWIYKDHPRFFFCTLRKDKIINELQNQWIHNEDIWGILEEQKLEWDIELQKDVIRKVNIIITV